MGTRWTSEKISEYHKFMAAFIASYSKKIDCADLAIEGLVEFAYEHRLPIKLKYFEKGHKRFFTSPEYEPINLPHATGSGSAAEQGVASSVAVAAAITTRNLTKKEALKKELRINLGAANVIDNTKKIEPSEARAGDFLMMHRPVGMGHTRVIYTMTPFFDQTTKKVDYRVVWYQGTHPPEVPTRQEDVLSQLVAGKEAGSGAPLVHEGKPRRWDFDAFEK